MDMPRRSDVIVVLAGETNRRPARAFELLDSGYASHLILDVPADAKIYQWTEPELAERYVQGVPESKSISICPIHGLSTKEEAVEAGHCLEGLGARRICWSPPIFTLAALNIFSRELPSYDYSVAAAYDPREFGIKWVAIPRVGEDEFVRMDAASVVGTGRPLGLATAAAPAFRIE